MMSRYAKIFKRLEQRVWSKDVIPVKASTIADFLWCPRRSYITFVLENSCDVADPEAVGLIERIASRKSPEAILGEEMHGVSYGFCVEPMTLPPMSSEQIYELAKGGCAVPREIEVHGRKF